MHVYTTTVYIQVAYHCKGMNYRLAGNIECHRVISYALTQIPVLGTAALISTSTVDYKSNSMFTMHGSEANPTATP